MAPKIPLPLLSPETGSRTPAPNTCPPLQCLGRAVSRGVSPHSLPLRHLSHCLGIGDQADPEKVVSGGVPRTVMGRRRRHLKKMRAAAYALAQADLGLNPYSSLY